MREALYALFVLGVVAVQLSVIGGLLYLGWLIGQALTKYLGG